MDIQKLSRKSYHLSVIIAMVLSAMVVTLASLLGRGLINIRGALITETPSELTVAELVRQSRPDISIKEVHTLPPRTNSGHQDSYVMANDGNVYLVEIDAKGPPWKLRNIELMREFSVKPAK